MTSWIIEHNIIIWRGKLDYGAIVINSLATSLWFTANCNYKYLRLSVEINWLSPPSSLRINVNRESGPVSRGPGKGCWTEKGTKYHRDSVKEGQQDYTSSTYIVGGGKSPGMIQENLNGLICHSNSSANEKFGYTIFLRCLLVGQIMTLCDITKAGDADWSM